MKPLQNDDLAKLLLRLAVGGLMLFHGIHKIVHGIAPYRGMLADAGLPEDIAWGIYLGEVVAPICLMLGFLTRPCGLLVSLTMAMSMVLAFGLNSFSLNEYGGVATELNLLYMIGGLSLFLTGGGRFSVTKGEGRWS